MDFLRVSGAIRCRHFPTSLRKGAMAWYHSLAPQSVSSWRDLADQFCRHFTASRKQPKTEAVLDAIFQGDNESPRNFIERFNKEVVQMTSSSNLKLTYNMRSSRQQMQLVMGEQAIRILLLNLIKSSQTEEEEEEEEETKGQESPEMKYSRDEIFKECNSAEFKECNSAEFTKAGIKFPRQTPLKPGQDKNRYCKYHKSYGHLTEDCIQLKDAIEILVRNGQLKQYVKKSNNPRPEAAGTSTVEEAPPEKTGHKPVALSISRTEDFSIPDYLEDNYIAPTLQEWETFVEAMVISGGGFDKHSVGSIKRKFEELIDASSNMSATLDKAKGQLKPLSFYMEELPGGAANSRFPCSSGSIWQIWMFGEYWSTREAPATLWFNGATTKPWGYVDLLVTFGSQETAKTIKVKFLVVDCPSLYQCILGRTAIADLVAVPSTAHLKMKYYTHKGQVATLHGDIEAARRCFNASSKGNEYIGEAPEAKKTKTPTSSPAPNISSIDLDSRLSKKENKEEKKLRKENKEEDEASKEHHRPIPDGEFELVPFGEDPSKGVKIGTGLPDLARKQLKACLRENADLIQSNSNGSGGQGKKSLHD
ncbi:uncharacterized protein LOC123886628 [Trifolium pratense]|uniref:uncharacterized protein LOC123886628 n=1 Tax=Trifolium pratense TaxID=57577 RepID=UPI001E692E62|nr:uncharacterized protein LOC123886628 [Trifolium pratense]